MDVVAEVGGLAPVGIAGDEWQVGVGVLGVGQDLEPAPLDPGLQVGAVRPGGVAIDHDVGRGVGVAGRALDVQARAGLHYHAGGELDRLGLLSAAACEELQHLH